MQVGDLVKVYEFTHKARRSLSSRLVPSPPAETFRVGLIIAGDGSPTLGDYRKVLFTCAESNTDFCSVHRMEVINESR